MLVSLTLLITLKTPSKAYVGTLESQFCTAISCKTWSKVTAQETVISPTCHSSLVHKMPSLLM
eukprot:UN02161